MRPLRILSASLIAAALDAASVPDGFVFETVVTGLDPAGMTIAPDGRVFILDKKGLVRVVRDGVLQSQPYLDITARVDNANERGLLGMAFDPDFATNARFYIYYTVKGSPARNRIARFAAASASATSADAAGETVLLTMEALSAGNHNGGGLGFLPDGTLLAGVGENGVSGNAKNLDTTLGKVLRLNRDGSFPTDNPFYTTASATRSAVWALGLRNPFSMAVRRSDGRVHINDVGSAQFEEINHGVAGSHYGWGEGIEGMKLPSKTPPTGYRDPIHAYGRSVGICICGGDFYPAGATGTGAFPAAWAGRYLFTDYGATSTTGWLGWIDPAAPATRSMLVTGIPRPIDAEVAPDGTVWVLSRGPVGTSLAANTSTSTGTLSRLTWAGATAMATRLAFLQQPGDTDAGVAIAPPVVVAAVDDGGNPVASASAAITVEAVGTLLAGATSAVPAGGAATFAALRPLAAGTGIVLVARSAGLAAATSAPFAVRAETAAPLLRPDGGAFTGPVSPWMSSETPGAVVRYTLDGSLPGTGSPAFNPGAPPVIAAGTVLRARAFAPGLTPSAAVSATFAISGTRGYGMAMRRPVHGVAMPATPELAPATLSGTGLFQDLATLSATPGVVTFTVASPLWSDGADKRRWVALPGEARIGFAPTGEFAWPAGTVMVKHFDLVTDRRQPTVARRLETRVFVVDPPGGASYGVTYRWRSDHTDADLVPEAGADEVIATVDEGGTAGSQTWSYPSWNGCMQCHTANAGFVLGPKTRQLNVDHAYPSGVVDNQLRTWNAIRMFTTDIGEHGIAELRRLWTIDDPAASAEDRVRSYLDANCAGCHRPGGAPTAWDARADTPFHQQGIADGPAIQGLGLADARLAAPGRPESSVILARMETGDPTVRMPPIGRAVVHRAAVDEVAAWVRTLQQPPGLRGEYWSGQTATFTGAPTLVRRDAAVDAAWGTAGPGGGVDGSTFTARWTGTVRPPRAGAWTFRIAADGPVRMWVGGIQRIDAWMEGDGAGTRTWSGTATLPSDIAVPVVVEYAQWAGNAGITLAWEGPDIPAHAIPGYRLAGNLPPVVALPAVAEPGILAAP